MPATITLRVACFFPENGVSSFHLNGASEQDRSQKSIWSVFDTSDSSYQNPSVFGQLIFFEIGQTEVTANVYQPDPGPERPPVSADAPYKNSDLPIAERVDDLDIPDDKAYIGATVKVMDLKLNEEIIYILVSESEADFMESKISVTSPIGKGLLGKAVDDEVEIQVPAGMLKYKVLEISRED